MLTAEKLRASIGARWRPDNSACKIDPPDWYTGAGGNNGGCQPGTWLQCNAVFPARVAVAATLGGTLLWDVSASNFQQFQPVGIHFYATDLVGGFDNTRAFVATDLRFADRNYLGSSAGLSLVSYGVEQQQALSVISLPTLTPGGQDVTMAVVNVDTLTNLVLFAWMYGWSRR